LPAKWAIDTDLARFDFRAANGVETRISLRLRPACESARGAGGVAAPPRDFRLRSDPGAFGEGRKSRATLRA
jgi:hypothetical protein